MATNETAAGPAAVLRNRVKGLREVPAGTLRANEANWRMHPQAQRDAISAMFRRVGFVGALIARELPNGELELIDGHLRADLASDQVVPVVVVDLNDDEMREVLATFDPISAMAIPDLSKLGELLNLTSLDEDAELRRLFTDIERQLAKEQEEKEGDDEDEHEVPGLGLQPHEHYDYLVVLAETTHEWNVLCGKLGLKPERRRRRMGTCRAIKASQLLGKLADAEKSDV